MRNTYDYTKLPQEIEKSRPVLGWNNTALNGLESGAKYNNGKEVGAKGVLGTLEYDIEALRGQMVKSIEEGESFTTTTIATIITEYTLSQRV